MRYLLLVLLFISCNQESDQATGLLELTNSKEFDSLKTSFEDEAYIRHINVNASSIKIGFTTSSYFKSITSKGVAFCQKDQKQIVINQDAWHGYSDLKKEIVVFHELGHCLLNKDHNNNEHLGEKLSIMHERILNPDFYEDNRVHYLDELFTGYSDLKTLI